MRREGINAKTNRRSEATKNKSDCTNR